MADLQDSISRFGRGDHSICLFKRAGNRFFNQDMNARREQPAGNLAMRFGGDSEAYGVDFADERAPISSRFDVEFRNELSETGLIEVADADKFATTLSRQVCVNAGVLTAKVSDADDCVS